MVWLKFSPTYVAGKGRVLNFLPCLITTCLSACQNRGREETTVCICINQQYVPTAIIITEDARSRKTEEESLVNKNNQIYLFFSID
jgi:hypothetical protein